MPPMKSAFINLYSKCLKFLFLKLSSVHDPKSFTNRHSQDDIIITGRKKMIYNIDKHPSDFYFILFFFF